MSSVKKKKNQITNNKLHKKAFNHSIASLRVALKNIAPKKTILSPS